jgi:hypothetical protein
MVRLLPLLVLTLVGSLMGAGDAPVTKGRPYTGPAMPASAEVLGAPYGFDFGVVPPHSILEGTFTLANRSSSPRKVLHTVPSCQCTTLDITGKTIPAGGTLEVPVKMKVSSTGRKSANVRILVENQDAPITLELKAEVAYAIRVLVPDAKGVPQPYVDAAEDPLRLKGMAMVRSTDGKPFSIRSVQAQPARFRGFDPARDAPRTEYEVDFDLPAEPCEQVPKYLIIETDRPEARLVDVRVRHACTRILPGLDIAEFRTNAGVVPAGGNGTFEIEVKKMVSNRLTSAQSLDPRFNAELIDQRADGSSVMGVVRLTPAAGVKGVFLIPVRLTAVDSQGRPYQIQRPEPAAPGAPPRAITLPSTADLLVYGVVE